MFSDVDESLRELLIADLPIVGGEVDVDFDRPTREWSGRLSKPTINLFLADIRERADFRFSEEKTTRSDANGTGTRSFPPRRFDLLYILTAWTKEPADEHRILARALRTMLRFDRIPVEAQRGAVPDAGYDIYLRSVAPDAVVKPVDLWGVLDNDARPSLSWVATVPVAIDREVTSPLVSAPEIRFGEVANSERAEERRPMVAGMVHRRGDPLAPVAGAIVTLVATGMSVTTDGSGRFVFNRLGAGAHALRVEADGAPATERTLVVPSREYRVEV